jgi:predicted NUDIX family NTP pyrophosphohydrolase
MAKKSAGLVMYRFRDSKLEVFLVHPGGPFWSKKDEGAWSIPKGEYTEDEDPFEVAKREFKEETGYEADGNFIPLSPISQPSRKIITAWAFEGNRDSPKIKSNTFTMEWPPRSGKQAEFPEVDRAEWFSVIMAKRKLLKGHVGFIEQLCEKLGYDPSEEENIVDNDHDKKVEPPKPLQKSLFD